MNLVKRLNNNAVIFFIFVIALPVLGFIASLYFGVYYERKPNISLVVLSSSNVLDVHEPVRDLSIEFQGKDIQKDEMNLRILRAKLVNDGGVDYYDPNVRWGIKVNGGEIVDARIVESNSEYIRTNLNPRLTKDEGLIQLEKLIFERGNYFILEILVLHGRQEVPKIMPVGKVAGIEQIRVSEVASGNEDANFIKQVFSGNPLVQATRSFGYFLFFIIILAVILLLALGLSSMNNARKRNGKKKEFWKLLGSVEHEAKRQYPKQLEILADIYTIRGKESLKTASRLLEEGSEENSRIREWLWRRTPLAGLSPLEEIKRQKDINQMERVARILPSCDEELEERDIVMALVDKRIVSEGKDKELVVDESFKKLLDGLLKDSPKRP